MHDMGEGHPEQPDRLRAIDRAMESEVFQMLARDIAPRAAQVSNVMWFAPKKIKKIAIVASLETIDQLREIACIYQTNV